jgi:hypothetical protein
MTGARLLLVVNVLANTRCMTTTRASVGSPASSAWFAEYDNRDTVVRFRPPWSSSLRGRLTRESQVLPTAQLPATQIRLEGSRDERTIPLDWVRDVEVVSHVRGAGEWALLGGTAGTAWGVVFALLVTDFGRTSGCSEGRSCSDRNVPKAVAGGLVYGVVLTGPIGAGVGALVGGVVGHRYVLTFD